MKLTLQSEAGVNLVRAYEAGRLRLAEREVTESLLLSPTELLSPWAVGEIAQLDVHALAPLLAWEPDICILGTGLQQIFPPPALIAAMASRGIGLEVMNTAAACRTYNVLVADGRRVAAALVL